MAFAHASPTASSRPLRAGSATARSSSQRRIEARRLAKLLRPGREDAAVAPVFGSREPDREHDDIVVARRRDAERHDEVVAELIESGLRPIDRWPPGAAAGRG